MLGVTGPTSFSSKKHQGQHWVFLEKEGEERKALGPYADWKLSQGVYGSAKEEVFAE